MPQPRNKSDKQGTTHYSGVSIHKPPAFWLQRLKRGTILTALMRHKDEAIYFFGALPTLRANPLELARIAVARHYLSISRNELVDEILRFNVDMHEQMVKLDLDKQWLTRRKLGKDMVQHVAALRKYSQKIVKDATGNIQ